MAVGLRGRITALTSRGRVRRTAARVLSVLPWLVFSLSAVSYFATQGWQGGATPQWLLLASTPVFFAVLVVRLLATAAFSRRRRRPVTIMTAAIVMWALGSASLSSTDTLTAISFPSTAELFFGPAYGLLVVYLLIDVARSSTPPASLWLESIIIVGGAACLLGFVVFTPMLDAFGGAGASRLLVLFYPMLDILLVSVVLGQVALRVRARSRTSLLLTGGFLGVMAADLINAGETLRASVGGALSYGSNQIAEILYGIGFALLVEASCRPRRAAAPATGIADANPFIVAAAAVAVGVLVLRPASSGLWYVTAPAVFTLVAAGFRLVLALKEARNAAESRRLALTDDLTGLPNRRAILADLQRGLRGDEPLGLLLLDLDGFKEVNDSLGHAAGDAVLREVGERLPGVLPGASFVGRLGGDEFAVVLRLDDPTRLLALAREAREALMSPLQVEGLDITVRATVGVTARREGDLRAADLLRRADVALYEAKTSRAGALLYDAARDMFTRERLQLTEHLRTGIDEGQLVVWYQPQVDTHTMRVTGMEALVRWRHPGMGVVSPMEFLPIARRAGLMAALTEVVMCRVVRDAGEWSRAGLDLRVSFNCAPPELLGTSLLPKLFDAIDEAGLPPDSLLVEVTEDSFVADPELARETLLRLREHNVQAAIDDYGTGFSSLAYLRDLPVQELKIDRSFVSTMLRDPRSHVIVDSTRQMAHAMGLRLVAEGVEDIETVRALADLDIDLLQGYYISKPMPVIDVVPWVHRWRAKHSSGALLLPSR